MATIIKVLEFVSESPQSWEAAAQDAVTEASKTVKNITGVDVIGFKGVVENGKITKYKVNCRVAFVVETK